MTWYELTDEIQYIPGTSMKGEVTYKAGFYDLPLGLQTHCFAPAGVDISAKWSVGGNAAGEQPEAYEMGVEKPRSGLYIREEVELKCNVLLSSFVKKNMSKSHKVLVDTMVRSATVPPRKPAPEIHHSDQSSLKDNVMPQQNRTTSSGYLNTSQPEQGATRSPSPAGRRAASQNHQCVCTGSKHVLACPYYSSTYSTPHRPPSAPAVHRPSLQLQAQSGVGNASPAQQSWSAIPSSGISSISSRDLHDSYASRVPKSRGENDLPASSVSSISHQDWPNQELKPQPLFHARPQSILMELDGDPVMAQHYYEYQAQRAELE